jgi:hypothetical protein
MRTQLEHIIKRATPWYKQCWESITFSHKKRGAFGLHVKKLVRVRVRGGGGREAGVHSERSEFPCHPPM